MTHVMAARACGTCDHESPAGDTQKWRAPSRTGALS